ncbi:hypothetical protein E2P86_05275 [Sphingobacterium psychroaquaticum]|uniref:translocation and assembly module lipoprotein TamL n=1 Tax=Sphingobacterium psychroaquaticum TaxID=561061 RepID=UPI00106D2F00|nr:BamA/TamA family outer membrane protein [Sphingobacterium psychroaquaticum]QBQ40593.1 hypothetical protein E2P86_05275 [Sphingobacterium psychroaquaticum]
MKRKKGIPMKSNTLFYFGSLLILASLAACSGTKHLAEDEFLYDKGTVTIHKDSMDAQRKATFETYMQTLLTPKPNKKFLGQRFKLGMYYAGGGADTTKNLVRNWLKKRGEEPVLLSDVNREYNENILRNRMENLGFFNSYVTSDTIIRGKLGEVKYNAFPGNIYRIAKINFEVDSLKELGRDIYSTRNQSLLQVGSNYNLDVIINERERIDNDLKNKGYYYFSPDNLLVEVDSTIGNHKVNMYVTLKPETPEKAKHPQKIGNIFIHPNYKVTDGGYTLSNPKRYELYQNNFYIIDRQNTYRKKVLANHIFFKRGDTYNRQDHNLTISHLVNLNAFKFVKNNFVDTPDSTNSMDVYYYLTPLPKRSLRFEALAKTASVYNGTEGNVNWTVRNAFKGFETVNLTLFGGYETQTGGNVNLNSSYLRYGAEVSITWPRLLSVYKWAPSRRFIPKTYTKVGYEFLNRRNAYTLNSLTINYGYNWKEHEQKQHDLALLEIIYVQPRNISAEYQAQMDTVPTLRHIVDPQFSFGPNYSYTFTNSMENKQHTFYAKAGLNTSGNVLGLIQGANYKDNKVETLFGTAYSQFVKVEADFRHYMKLTPKSTLASRIMIGTSYSYGNSKSLPYLKQYYTGGPNGLRAFRARSVGPGSSMPENIGKENFFADQTGDFKLELNTEYRAQISGMFHWAFFIDAGNVWLQREDENKPGGKLTGSFLKELAVGAGAGLRFDLDFLIIRTDLALPIRVPYRPSSERWVFKEIDFGSSTWRHNNLIFNLAIGYPF